MKKQTDDGSVKHSGDDTTGEGAGDDDGECLAVGEEDGDGRDEALDGVRHGDGEPDKEGEQKDAHDRKGGEKCELSRRVALA